MDTVVIVLLVLAVIVIILAAKGKPLWNNWAKPLWNRWRAFSEERKDGIRDILIFVLILLVGLTIYMN